MAEVYFGTFLDVSNTLSSGLKARIGDNGSFRVEWPRATGSNVFVEARAEWSSDLAAWTTNGLGIQKIGEDAENWRQTLEASVPAGAPAGYFRLLLRQSPPPASD